jgi:hypothetical protein
MPCPHPNVMSDFSFMNDISMAELRMVSILGLLVTAIIATLLAVLVASGGAALGRLARHALGRDRGMTAPRSSPAASNRLVPNGHGGARDRREAWRPRL